MAMSAFGVDDTRLSKADNRRSNVSYSTAYGGAAGGAIGTLYGNPNKAWHIIRATQRKKQLEPVLHHIRVPKAPVLGAGIGAGILGASALEHNHKLKVKAEAAAARKRKSKD